MLILTHNIWRLSTCYRANRLKICINTIDDSVMPCSSLGLIKVSLGARSKRQGHALMAAAVQGHGQEYKSYNEKHRYIYCLIPNNNHAPPYEGDRD
jgi:hypothetical protein